MKRRLWLLFPVIGIFACNELPEPPAIDKSGYYLDTAGVWRDSLTKFYQDPSGIWRDSIYGIPFVDVPPSFREFWRHCSGCHSSSGKLHEAPEARKYLRLDTWEEMLAHGPNRLLLAARGGGMPLARMPRVPEDVMGRAQAYLASWGGDIPIIIQGFNYGKARDFVRNYCADCHAPGGKHPEQVKATTLLLLDTYAQWHRREQKIKFRIDTVTLQTRPLESCPPDSLPFNRKPSITQRLEMMKWIDSLSPNTADGSGVGDSPSLNGIVMEGAMEGTLYDTAFKLLNRYCADCHTQGGLNPYQPSAWNYVFRLDTYQDWKFMDTSAINGRLDKALALQNGYESMPPSYFPLELTDSERQVLLDWLSRGSPNSDSGK